METTRVLRRLCAFYRLQARFYLRFLGAFGILPRPLVAAMLRRVDAARPAASGGTR